MRQIKLTIARVRKLLHAEQRVSFRGEMNCRGTFEDFLSKLLAIESGIDPARFETYVREYESPVMRYARAVSPGRVIRDTATGGYRFEPMTVPEYFKTLGVDHLFDSASAACMRRMQYAST